MNSLRIPEAPHEQLELRGLSLDRGDMGRDPRSSISIVMAACHLCLSSLFFPSPLVLLLTLSLLPSVLFIKVLLHVCCILCMYLLVYTEQRDLVWEQTVASRDCIAPHPSLLSFRLTWSSPCTGQKVHVWWDWKLVLIIENWYSVLYS